MTLPGSESRGAGRLAKASGIFGQWLTTDRLELVKRQREAVPMASHPQAFPKRGLPLSHSILACYSPALLQSSDGENGLMSPMSHVLYVMYVTFEGLCLAAGYALQLVT